MKRRKFFRITGVTTLGAVLSRYLMANTFSEISVLTKSENLESDRFKYLYQRISGLPPREISMDHVLIMTHSFKKSEGKPLILRRALAFYDIVDQIPISIDKGELIVGNISSKPRVSWFSPSSYACQTAYDQLSKHVSGKPVMLSHSIFSSAINAECMIPQEVSEYWRNKPVGGTVGHFIADYGKVLKIGYSGIIKEIEASKELHLRSGNLDKQKNEFFEAAIITAKAAIRFAERHADLAFQQSKSEVDPVRKAELQKIADICRRCPSEPAQTFYEAMESFWLTHVLLHLNSCEWSISPGRFDQYMYPFYRKDIEKGRLKKEQAEELMSCLWIKFNEIRVGIDIVNYQNLMVGGVDEDGNDATNDLSYLCLQVQKKFKEAPQPSLSMRWHQGTPIKLLDLASEVILTGSGRPAMFGDPANIAALTKLGVPLKEARNYAIAGCEEIAISGKSYGAARGGDINNPQCLLNTIKKNDEKKFEHFEDLLLAYKQEVSKTMRKGLNQITEKDRKNAEYTPHPFASILFEDCIIQGKDITKGGVKYNLVSVSEAGCITAANSLYVIKKAVFEDKVFTIVELQNALKNDFKGYESIRAYSQNRIPKFGNDIDEVDDFATKIVDLNYTVINELNLQTYTGGLYIIGSGISSAWKAGENIGATPDGRKSGKSFSVSYGPANGTDINGPTAMLNSVSKLKWENQPGGALTHVRLPISGVDNKFSNLNVSSLISTFFEKGGMGVHFSIMDAKALREAIKDPLNHLDLIVRVGGYSAQFVLLSPFMQQEILERTEQQVM